MSTSLFWGKMWRREDRCSFPQGLCCQERGKNIAFGRPISRMGAGTGEPNFSKTSHKEAAGSFCACRACHDKQGHCIEHRLWRNPHGRCVRAGRQGGSPGQGRHTPRQSAAFHFRGARRDCSPAGAECAFPCAAHNPWDNPACQRGSTGKARSRRPDFKRRPWPQPRAFCHRRAREHRSRRPGSQGCRGKPA